MSYTRTPNAILDQLPEMDNSELKLTMLLVRLTFGYFENGRHTEEVKLTFDDMAAALGVARGTVNRAVQLVESRGIFRRGRRSMWFLNGEYSLNSRLNALDYSAKTELKAGLTLGKIVQELDQNSLETELNSLDFSTEIRPSSIYKKKKKKIEREEAPPPTSAFWLIPENLKDDEFIRLWGTWLEYVDEANLRFTEKQAAVHLAQLSDAGLSVAINSVKVSLLRGWKNIYITTEAANGRFSPTPTNGVPLLEEVEVGSGLY